MNEQKFQKGDKCTAFGLDCEIVEIREGLEQSITVKFKLSGLIRYFYSNGTYEKFHSAPSLFLVERPKKMKKVKRLVGVWANVYPESVSYNDSRYFADRSATENRIGEAVYLCKEIEYEVEATNENP